MNLTEKRHRRGSILSIIAIICGGIVILRAFGL